MSTSILTAFATVMLTGSIGALLAFFWHDRQKRREQGIAVVHEFYRLYGEFTAIWRIWIELYPRGEKQQWPERLDEMRWALHERCCAAEAAVEATLLKLAAERRLDARELATLGAFRQGYKKLRRVLRRREAMRWLGDSAFEYSAFRFLAAEVAVLVGKREPNRAPGSRAAVESVRVITSNFWEPGNPGDWRRFVDESSFPEPASLHRELDKLRAKVAYEAIRSPR